MKKIVSSYYLINMNELRRIKFTRLLKFTYIYIWLKVIPTVPTDTVSSAFLHLFVLFGKLIQKNEKISNIKKYYAEIFIFYFDFTKVLKQWELCIIIGSSTIRH